MAASSTVIGNLALSHCGIGKLVGSLSERSEEARALNLFYPEDLKTVLEALDWPFARKYVTLGLVEEDPNDEWGYSYRYPADCVVARKILSGIRKDSPDNEIEMELSSDDSGKLIFCDMAEAQLKYTALIDDTTRFSANFTRALSYKLAHSIAPRLTAGDPFKLQDKLWSHYLTSLNYAAAIAASEQKYGVQPEAEMIRGR